MDIPKDYIAELKKRSRPLDITSERQELIQRLVDRINLERVGTEFKPVTWKQINGLVRHLKEGDLYWLFGECEDAQSFSKKFFGVLKGNRAAKPK